MKGHNRIITTSSLNYDGKLIISGSEDRTIKVWDSKSGKCLSSLIGHENVIMFVSF